MEFHMKDVGFYSVFPYGRLDVAGDDVNGFRPVQLLVSAITVCSGGVLRQILSKMRMEVEDISITAEVDRNEAEANRVEKIALHFKIKGPHLSADKIAKVMPLVDKHCSMIQSVKNSIEVTKNFEVI